MGTALTILFATIIVSFIGSLQLGPLNLFVINSALFHGKRTAFLIAIGGCVPEFIFCALAVFANNYLFEFDRLILFFKIAFIIVLIIVGVVFYFKKQSILTIKNKLTVNRQPMQHVLKGFSLAILNPQLLPFWMFVQVYFNSIKFLQIQSNSHKLFYIAGSGIGAFILLAFFINVTMKYRETILKYINNKYYFKALSLLFFVIAGHQTWLLINP